MDINDHSRLYNAYYYSHGCGHDWGQREAWFQYIDLIADHIVKDINPSTALDAGCAMGHLVWALRQRGVQAFGLDLSEFAIRNASADAKSYCWVGSVTEPLPNNYDLIICIEVLEHLPHMEAERAVENLCRYSDDILFSSTPFDYKEVTHFNVQPLEYWAEAFARQGFLRDLDSDASFITPWAVRYRRSSSPLHQIVRHYERHFWLLWKQNFDLRAANLEMRNELAASEKKSEHLDHQVLSLQAQISEADRQNHNLQNGLNGSPQNRRQRLRKWLAKLSSLRFVSKL